MIPIGIGDRSIDIVTYPYLIGLIMEIRVRNGLGIGGDLTVAIIGDEDNIGLNVGAGEVATRDKHGVGSIGARQKVIR